MDEIINSFVETLRRRDDCLGVILFGSWARGNARPDSDVDLIVILKEGFTRAVESYQGAEFEIIYTTPQSAADYWKGDPDGCVDLWNSASVLYDRDGTVERLRLVADEIRAAGKTPVSGAQRAHIAFDAADQLKAIEALLETDKPTGTMLLEQRAYRILSDYFDLNGLWKPAPKQLLAGIAEPNPEAHALFASFFSGELPVGERLTIVKRLTELVVV